MTRTTSKTQTVTNTQLGVAVMAAFLAGGLAFAAAPAMNNKAALVPGACVLSEATMVYTHAINKTRQLCPNNGYWGARFTCTDRKADTVNVGVGNPCVTQEQILAMARAKCANLAHSCVPRNVVAPLTGTLSLNMDNNILSNGSDIFLYPRYILNGTNSLVGRVRVQAGPQEAVNLKSLAFNIISADPEALRSHISSFGIYSSQNILDNAIPLAQITLDDMQTNDLNYQIPAGQTDYIYIKANTIEINENTASGTPMQNVGFTLSLRDPQPSQGAASATAIQPTINYNSQSTRVDIQPVIITGLRDTSIGNGNLVGGNQTLFSFGAAATAGNNRTRNGDAMSATIDSLKLRIDTDIPHANFSNLELCRVETNDCMDLMFSSTTPNVLTSVDPNNAQYAFPNHTSVLMRDNRAFYENGSRTVTPGEQANFIVRGTVFPTPESFIQMRISEVHNAGFAYSFEWDDDFSPDGYSRDLRLTRDLNVNYPDILGQSLVN